MLEHKYCIFIQVFSGDNLYTIAIQRDLEPVLYAALWITLCIEF